MSLAQVNALDGFCRTPLFVATTLGSSQPLQDMLVRAVPDRLVKARGSCIQSMCWRCCRRTAQAARSSFTNWPLACRRPPTPSARAQVAVNGQMKDPFGQMPDALMYQKRASGTSGSFLCVLAHGRYSLPFSRGLRFECCKAQTPEPLRSPRTLRRRLAAESMGLLAGAADPLAIAWGAEAQQPEPLVRSLSNTGAEMVMSGGTHPAKGPRPPMTSRYEGSTTGAASQSPQVAPAGAGAVATAIAILRSTDKGAVAARESRDRRPTADDAYATFDKEWEIDPRDITVINETVASGTFGDVFRASWRGITVCVKRLKPAFANDSQALAELRAELSIWCRLHHVRASPSPIALCAYSAPQHVPQCLLLRCFFPPVGSATPPCDCSSAAAAHLQVPGCHHPRPWVPLLPGGRVVRAWEPPDAAREAPQGGHVDQVRRRPALHARARRGALLPPLAQAPCGDAQASVLAVAFF